MRLCLLDGDVGHLVFCEGASNGAAQQHAEEPAGHRRHDELDHHPRLERLLFGPPQRWPLRGRCHSGRGCSELHAQLVECMPHSVAAGDRYPDVEVLGGEELLMELPAHVLPLSPQPLHETLLVDVHAGRGILFRTPASGVDEREGELVWLGPVPEDRLHYEGRSRHVEVRCDDRHPGGPQAAKDRNRVEHILDRGQGLALHVYVGV
mmetsp:Transcript_16997/g.46040  ORF Transcript_16997/g.46040 Transcript_16997/m.46040 type:complete len:207 (+) Transcript_16997:267-887(+)